MKSKASGTFQVYLTAEFEDDGSSIGDQAHEALLKEARSRFGLCCGEIVNFYFDRKIEEEG